VEKEAKGKVLLLNMKVIPAGERMISKEADRYKIRLPKALNHIWRMLHEKRIKVRVYLEISVQNFANE